ncbi:MAG TPA: ElyC/SanA/YdcF family protein, partial [Opitutus sp.]|nr:ElyC/SanA/YdcF family protein [Opitutus sp.]
MGFALKKFVSFWIMPLPLCLAVLAVGYGLLLTKRRTRAGRALVGIALVLLLLFSNRTVSKWLVRPLEEPFRPVPELRAGDTPPAELARCRYIVVLGGGHADVPMFSAVNQLSTSALSRLAEGVRLTRALPGTMLVVCGRGAPGRPSHAAVLADAAVSLGVDRERIILLDEPRDTEEEAAALAT